MSTLTIQLDDHTARLVAEAAQAANQPLEHWLRESVSEAATRTINRARPEIPRVSPLHPGAMHTTPDFDAPLEEFAPYV